MGWNCLYTKLQVETMLTKWNLKAEIPKKGKCLWIINPLPQDSAKITFSEFKSPEGKRLYKLEFFNKQEIDAMVKT